MLLLKYSRRFWYTSVSVPMTMTIKVISIDHLGMQGYQSKKRNALQIHQWCHVAHVPQISAQRTSEPSLRNTLIDTNASFCRRCHVSKNLPVSPLNRKWERLELSDMQNITKFTWKIVYG